MCKILAGDRHPKVDIALRLAQAMGISLDYVFNYKPERYGP